MYEARVQFALDNFIRDDFFSEMHDKYVLLETEESGRSELTVKIANDNLCIESFDKKPHCEFLRTDKKYGMRKRVDHIIFEKNGLEWKLHLIEMKSNVGYKKWVDSIKPKVRSSYLVSLALADILGIQIKTENVMVYTTYENDKFDIVDETVNPKAFVPLLGEKANDEYKDEWHKDRIILNLGEELILPHKKIQMIKNDVTNVLEGSMTL